MAQDQEHTHEHSHAPTVSGKNEHKVLLSFILIFTFMIVEVIGGLVSGSLALLADAGHMLTDAAALALAYVAFRLGRKAADSRRTFGYLRFEVIAGFINALTLFAIVVWIINEAWRRFQEPHDILAGPMLGVAIVGLLVNIIVFWILTRGDSEHVNIKGAALHVMGDLLGSVGAISAAVIIYYTGWSPIDPILSVVVSLLILRSAWRLLRESLHILLEGAPADADPAAIERHLIQSVAGVESVSHIHVWLITSGKAMATLHVRPKADYDASSVVSKVEQELKSHFDIEHVTVATDWRSSNEDCSLTQSQETD
ncbi:cation diffusion facilitator family transporter [Saccharospirillum sp.]|uniref:cation diffusion facilitator family transporter n=1 Tax=Saccharospirillum sp. TaxID=2033801 RepID=UPI0034A03026